MEIKTNDEFMEQIEQICLLRILDFYIFLIGGADVSSVRSILTVHFRTLVALIEDAGHVLTWNNFLSRLVNI
jgi:hypothetical protein